MKLRSAPLAIIFATLVIDTIGIGLVFPIVPRLVEEVMGGNLSHAALVYGWLVALYALMQFLAGPLMGALSDRFGRRPIILISLFGLAADYLFLAAATNIWWLLGARIVGGVLGASFTTASAYIADISPPEKRAQNFGLLGVAFGIGFVAGPFLGGILGEYGTRLPFYAGAGLALVAWIFAIFMLPESLPPENRRRFRLREANPVGALIVVTRYRAVLVLVLCLVFSNLAERMLESVWVLFAGYRFDWGPAEVGFSLAAVGILFIVSQGLLVRVVVPWLGEWRTITIGLICAAVSFFLYAFAPEGWMMYVIMLVHIFGWSTAGPAIQSLATKAVPPTEQGLLQGAFTSLMTASGIVGAPLATSLFGYFVSPAAPFAFPGVAFFLGGILFLVSLGLVLREHAKGAPALASSESG